MSFNRAIVDDLYEKRHPIPKEDWRFVDPDEVEVRTLKPRWTWVARACHEVPIGKCILFPLPDEYKGRINEFMQNMRNALGVSRKTYLDKFSVRRSKHENYVVVMKSGVWSTMYRAMETQ